MTETTTAHREAELRQLLDRVSDQPNRKWESERARIAVLQRQLGAKAAANA